MKRKAVEEFGKITENFGKIESVHFGYGGYQDVMFGFTFVLSTKSGNVIDFKGMMVDQPSENTKWNRADQVMKFGEVTLWLVQLMKDAKVTDFKKLVGIPVLIKLDGYLLMSWRILTEVL